MSAPAQHLFTVTDAHGLAHLVTDESMTAGHRSGRYLTICDQQVLTASLTTPEHRPCRRCTQRRTTR